MSVEIDGVITLDLIEKNSGCNIKLIPYKNLFYIIFTDLDDCIRIKCRKDQLVELVSKILKDTQGLKVDRYA